MFEVEINGEKVKAEVSFLTAQIYEAEFGGDIIKDFFGKQDSEPVLDVEGSGDDERIVQIDFTKLNWNAIMKLLWAAIKTADEYAPSYSSWVKTAKGVNMWFVQEILGVEVADCFFRA